MTDQQTPDGIVVPQPSFNDADWQEIKSLRVDLATARSQLEHAEMRMVDYRVVVDGLVQLQIQMRSGTAAETAKQQMTAMLDSLVAKHAQLGQPLKFDNSLRTAHTDLAEKYRATTMLLIAERAAGNARVDYLLRECRRISEQIPGLNDALRLERVEAEGLRAKVTAMEATKAE